MDEQGPKQPPVVDTSTTHAAPAAPSEHTRATTTAAAAAAELPDAGDGLPPADVTPERIADLPTATDHAPVVAGGDPQRPDDPETEDLGWSEDPLVPVPVVHGMDNEHLWVLVRRFNNQIYHVKAIPHPPPGRLDLNIADKDEFSPDKLRSTVERLYITVIVCLAAAGKHIARIRSWTERRRTAAFCAVYFTAWRLDLLLPLFLSTLILLIIHPPARTYLFPPAPLAAISVSSGTVKAPPAGHLGSKDSLTGAAEEYKGEAVEQEASNFVTGLTSIAVGAAAGKDAPPPAAQSDAQRREGEEKREKGEKDVGQGLPDPTAVGDAAEAQSRAKGDKTAGKDKPNDPPAVEQTKQPMQDAMWEKTRPIMHILGDIADGWERFANALSPTPPFARTLPRLRLAAVVLPLLLASLFVPASLVYKGTTFGIGFALFGQPVIDWFGRRHLVEFLDRRFPGWEKALELRNSILLGVPTNAQLTITLLRLGEANKSPLPPPPPTASTAAPSAPAPPTAHPDDLPPEYSEQAASVHADAQLRSSPAEDEKEHEHEGHAGEKMKKKGSKIVGLLKGTTKAGVKSVLGADKVKAKAGSEPSKARLGVVEGGDEEEVERRKRGDGPTSFHARFGGKKGMVVVSTTATSPLVAFERETVTPVKPAQPVFSIAIDDIREIRKVGGLGWKGKLAVGWALNAEVTDGVEIIDAMGNSFKVTAIQRRDELFNRLIALGKHNWESW